MIGPRLFLAQFRAYWRLRARLDDFDLRIRRIGFTFRSHVAEEADSSTAVRHIVRLTLFDLSVAMLLSAGVWWANGRLSFLGVKINDEAYVQLASGVAGIGGVFIGLYYAAMTAAMTAVYAEMPNSVSQLLMQERFGNAYMRFVATLTFMAVNLLALHAMSIPTNTVGTPLLAIGAGIAIFGFVKLGTWAFRLFDPTAVSHAVFRDLRGLFRQVVVGGYQWQSAAFQQYAQRRCAKNLHAIAELADACQESRYLREEPLVRLGVSTLHFATYSVVQRPKIPTKSLWFPHSYSQPDWYRAPDSQTSIAHHTGTLLQPQTVQDKWWLEKQCENIAVTALVSLLGRRELESARSLMSAFESYVEGLARQGWITEALAIVMRLEDSIASAVIDAAAPDGERLVDRVALLDYIGRMQIICVLRAADWADELDRARIQTALAGVDWMDTAAPHSLGLRAYAVGRAEWLAERLMFERLVSGRRVTPDWYCGELLAQEDAEALGRASKALCHDVFERTWAVIDRALEKQRLWEAACLLSDAFHYVRKLERHLDRLMNAMTKVSADRRIRKLPWPEDNFEALAKGIDEQYAKVVERMAGLIPRLPAKPEDLPDYAGQFLHAATEEVFECVIKRDTAALANLFPGTFVGCIAKHDALRPVDLKPDDPWLEGAMSLSLAPILDLVELSGYSYLLSEIFPDQKTWPVVERVWDTLLEGQNELGERMVAIIAFSKGQFAITPRSLLRTNWHSRIERILRTLPTRQAGRGFSMHQEIDHPSAFVRRVVHPGPMSTMYDGADLFAATYLLQRPDIPHNTAHRQASELAGWMARQRDNATRPDQDSE